MSFSTTNNIEHPENHKDFKGLNVNSGIEKPPSVNPNLGNIKRKKRQRLTSGEYVEGIRKGNITILSQAVTLIESSKMEHAHLAQEIIEKCLPFTGNATRLGITGVPGAGKSTFIEALGMHIVRQKGKLAVLAIDPSSERSKGSILGDKTRMEELSCEHNAYIRPSPSAGSLGGVARKTRETIILCEAAGFDTIFVETVGVGQSETAVHSMVDFFLLIQIAGAGDELQGIKRGIMEMSDGIAINKADGSNIDRANLAAAEIKNALHLFPLPDSGWSPNVLTCSALTKENVNKVWEMVQDYVTFTKENGFFFERRNRQAKYWMYESINEKLKESFYQDQQIKGLLGHYEQDVLNDGMSSFVAAHKLLSTYFDSLKK